MQAERFRATICCVGVHRVGSETVFADVEPSVTPFRAVTLSGAQALHRATRFAHATAHPRRHSMRGEASYTTSIVRRGALAVAALLPGACADVPSSPREPTPA